MNMRLWGIGCLCLTLLAIKCLCQSSGATESSDSIKSTTSTPSTKPSAPNNIILTASNHTAVEVAWDPQSTNDKSDVFFAYVDESKANYCRGERNESKCTITDLLPHTPYKVCVRACQPNTTASSLGTGSPLVSSGDVLSFSSNLESDMYICSEPTCTSVTIGMQAPNNIILTASNHTAVEVAWDPPSIKDDSDVFAAYIKGLDANKCQGEQNESKCTIGSLLPLTPYTVCVLACHPNATMAPTVTTLGAGPQLASGEDVFAFSSISKSDKYICSEPTCASVTIPMQAPTYINLTASNHTAVEVAWDAQSTNDKSDVFFAYVDGSEGNHCRGEANASECTITDLLPRTPYKVCVRACQPNTTVTPLFTDAQLVSSRDFLAVGSNLESDMYICSEPTCASVTIAMQAPSNIKLTAKGHTAVDVKWDAPSDKEPVDVTVAYVAGSMEKNCTAKEGKECTIDGLLPRFPYKVCVRACHPHMAAVTAVSSSSAEAHLVSSGDLLEFVTNAKTSPYTCSNAVCNSVTIPMQVADNLLLKILLGIFIPLIIIILLVLLFVFRKRIPFIRNLFEKESTMGDGESDTSCQESSTPFPIEYYTPPGPGTLSNVPPPIPIENFAANLRELDANNGFQALFQTLNSLAASEIVEKYRLTKVAATQGGNRNRYSDMPPYDQSLVLVGRPWSTVINDPQPQITASEVEKGYINASYVRRPEYGSGGEALVSSFSTRPAYIATQGPLRSTVTDFLTMVCQQRCPLIIMLCQCIEDGKIKCTQYWPDGMTSTFESAKCTVEVRKESEENLGSVIRRELKIHPSSEASPWTVTQFHFTDWVDNSVPNVESFYNLVVMQNDFLATHPMGVECGPTIVHCSAGVGRTGTFMAARFLLDRLRTNPQNVDIVGTVLAMRKWRANLVQVWSQLQFLYNFIDFCLGKENLGVKQIAPGPKALPAAPSAEYQNIGEQSEMNAMEPARPPVPPKRNP